MRKVFAITQNPDFLETDETRFENNAFAYNFKEARLATAAGPDIGITKYPGRVSTVMRHLTCKDSDFLSYFD